ncbi:hypothetical protein THO17_21700 [Marinomonas sp. THO17]
MIEADFDRAHVKMAYSGNPAYINFLLIGQNLLLIVYLKNNENYD